MLATTNFLEKIGCVHGQEGVEFNSNCQEIISNLIPTFLADSARMHAWSRRLNEKFKEKGLTKRDLARASGVPYDTVNKCLRGGIENPRGDVRKRLAKALGVTEAWLLTGTDKSPAQVINVAEEPASEWNGELARVPAYDLRLSAGPGSFVEHERPLYFQPFRIDFLRALTRAPVTKLALLNVAGDSMAETLRNGDQVLIDMTQTRARDGIFALRLFDDDLVIKRLTVAPNPPHLITVSSDNPAARSYPDLAPDSIVIIGRMIWFGRLV